MSIDFDIVSKKLNTQHIGKPLYVFDSVTSTNEVIKDYPCENGLTIASKSQTNGRGRLGRSWSSGDGGMYFSFMLTPPYKVDDVPFITIMSAVAVCNVLNKIVPCSIKWPNDIVINGKKVCGILTQSNVNNGEIEYIVVGIGINANVTEFPDAIINTATSLKIESEKEVNENNIFCDILENFENIYYNTNRKDILNMFKQNCATLGCEVTVHFHKGQRDVRGVCMDITEDASLVVKTDAGENITVSSGEVSVRGIYGYAD